MKPNKVKIMMEEYKSLRSQIRQSLQNRNTILNFCLATIGVILHAGVYALSDSPSQTSKVLAFFIFSSFLPALSLALLTIWCGEMEFMGRTGFYLLDFEDKIKDIYEKEKILYWENWVREIDKEGKMIHKIIYPYHAVGALFIGIAAGSLAFAYFFLYQTVDISIKGIIVFVTLVIIIIVPLWVFWRYERGKDRFKYP